MNLLKKIFGIVLLLIVILISSFAFYAVPIMIEKSKKKFDDNVIGAPGYAIGNVIIFGGLAFIIYFLIKMSFKLIRKKKVNATIIDKIGWD